MRIRWVFAAIVILSSPPCFAAIDTIIPLPKEIRAVGQPVPLDGFRIVAAGDERSQIGAAEINQRIASLGGQVLPVEPLDGRLPAGKCIVVAPCTAKELTATTLPINVTPANPGPQGYVIQPAGSGEDLKLLLVGSDALGTLYAAVTFRQLIIQQEGQLWIQPAAVRDWPDYKTRCNGAPFSENLRGDWYGILSAEASGDLAKARRLAEGWVAAQKRHFDWLLRAKINMAWNRTNIDPGDARDKTTVARAALKEVHEYGWKRGIEAIDADTTSIGRFPQDKDNSDLNGCVLSKSHGKYFCWSRLDYHQRRAERAAQWLADCGYRGYYLHATDSGGWSNPALWDERCDECRKNYGDDHAKADATVFGIYYRAIKQRIPDAKFVAVVYPYTGRYLDPGYIYRDAASAMGQGEAARGVAERACEKLTAFLHRLDSLLPPDIAICIRESERKHLDLARHAWGRRPFYLYYEYAFWKGWRPDFLTTPLMTRSLYYPEYDDILFGNVSGSGWREVTQLLGVECAWNVNRPGAMDFDSAKWHDWGTAVEVPEERRAFAERACRFWFGEQAGPLMAPVFAENISHHFICFPEEVLDQVKLADPVQTMQEQSLAAGHAAMSLDKLWALQQHSPALSGDQYGYFLNLYQMTHAAKILAGHRAAVMAARRAIQQGDRSEALRQLAAARALLDQEASTWSALNKQIPQNRRFASPSRKTSTAGLLSTLDPAELRKEIDDLDIGGDPDDQQSMVRLMMYSNEFDIEGLIATASGTPGELNQAVTKPQLIHEIVDAYGQVRDNLALHADGYPTVDDLRARIKSGNPQRGLDAIGERPDTDGSRWIIAVVDRPDPRPVNITIWGGQTDLAQALWRVRTDRGADGLKQFIDQIRIYDIGDQDRIVDWIWREFPGLFYVLGQAADGRDKREAVYRGMYLGGDQSLTSREWMETNIRQGHGPLGVLYPTRTWTAPNPHSAMKEGDTPSWFYFLLNGLNTPEHPTWGGWGGRFVPAQNRSFRDAQDTVEGVTDGRSTVWRWRDAFQRDFQARMDWCVQPRAKANHPPVAVCNGDVTQAVLTQPARSGSTIRLSAAASRDPDGDRLTYRWWVYSEAGTYLAKPAMTAADVAEVTITLPPNAVGDLHVILEVTDAGQPPLTIYRRVVVTVN